MNIIELIKKAWQLGLRLGCMKMMGYEGVFTCAYRNITAGEMGYTLLPYSSEYWYADPLPYVRNGKVYVFMEAFDREKHLGRIAYSELAENGWGNVHLVISEKFHLSFPMIFEMNGNIYMLPETSTAQRQMLYRCIEFPDRWEKTAELFPGERLVDSVIIKKENNKVTVLASECDTENALRARFVLFDLIFEGNSCCAVMHDSFNRVQKYEYYHRNAGKITRGGLLPLQRSTAAIYGYALMFINAHDCIEKLHTVGDIAYSKSEKELLPSEIKMNGRTVRPIGTHTYSENSGFEIIDIQYLERNPDKNKQRRPAMKNQV